MSPFTLASKNAAIHDRLAVVFHGYLLFLAFFRTGGPHQELAQQWSVGLFSITFATLVLVRGELLPAGRIRALIYRLGIFVPMMSSYFELGHLLPALQPRLLDAELYAIDRAIMGETPAIWFQAFNTRPVVEYIAGFYYSYFYVMAVAILPVLFLDKGRRQHEMLLGAFFVCALGHIGYTLVPGMGPVVALEFEAPLDGGFFWGKVIETVTAAGSQLDIFPSLHTAYPWYFALHAFAFRKTKPYTWAWPLFAIFAAHMLVATTFLRWHWAVDVVAGLCLAFTSRWLAAKLGAIEAGRREGDDERPPVWEPLLRG